MKLMCNPEEEEEEVPVHKVKIQPLQPKPVIVSPAYSSMSGDALMKLYRYHEEQKELVRKELKRRELQNVDNLNEQIKSLKEQNLNLLK